MEDEGNEDMGEGDACRKFGIILGEFRTEVEVLAELHLKYPWIQLTRRMNGTGSAILITRDNRSRKLLAELKTLNGKECSFRSLGNQARKAYIMMGVPSCVTEELLQQDKEVFVASRMTKWNTEKKQAEPTNMMKIVLVGKQHPARFTRGYGSFRMRSFVSRPLQCFNCQKFGHQARTCRSEVQTCRYCAGRHASSQCKDNVTLTLKCVNYGQGYAASSRLCPKKLEAENKLKTSQTPTHLVPITKQVNRNPAPIPLKNAWASLTIQEVAKRPFSGLPSTPQSTHIEEPIEVSTNQPKQTTRNSIPKSRQNRKAEPVKVVSAPQPTTNAWTKPFVPSTMDFPLATSANRTKRPRSGQSTNQQQQKQTIQTKRQQHEEEQMDDVLETIQIALSGATSLLKKISIGNTCLVPALKKIMEAAMDAINTLTL